MKAKGYCLEVAAKYWFIKIMNTFFQSRILKHFPIIPIGFFKSLTKICGKYPESTLSTISTLVGNREYTAECSEPWCKYKAYKTPASICDITATWIWRCLIKEKPNFIIEFGTGFSTLVMAAYAEYIFKKTGQTVQILSIEHDEKWFKLQQCILSRLGIEKQINLMHLELNAQSCLGQQTIAYSGLDNILTSLNSGGKADFIFVDGPVGLQYGGTGRRGSILQSIEHIRKGGLILIHDALRSEEFGFIEDFSDAYPNYFICKGIVPEYGGLAICKKPS